MRQRIVDGGHFVVQHVGIVLVAIDTLLDDSLVVRMQRVAGIVETARPHEAARFGLEQIELAVAVLVGPFADRISV